MEKILFVDDDPHVLKGYHRQLADIYEVETAAGGKEGMSKIACHGPYAVVVSDMRMPEIDGIQFLFKVKEDSPDTVRMMLTGYADVETAMEAVNKGNIFRLLTKPCMPETLRSALDAGVDFYRLIRAEKDLLEQTLTGSVKALIDILSLGNPEIFGRTSRIKRYVLGLAEHLRLPEIWQLEIAASLSQIGCVILSQPILEKVNAGEPLTPHEMQAYNQHPIAGTDILRNIPRMQDIAAIISYQNKHFDGTDSPHDPLQGENIPMGARLLKVATDFDALRMQDIPRSEAFEQLEARKGWYDPKVVEALKQAFVPAQKFKLIKMSLSELQPHMVMAEGVSDTKGNLLVAKGQILTEWMVNKLKEMSGSREIKEPIRIIVPDSPTPECSSPLAYAEMN